MKVKFAGEPGFYYEEQDYQTLLDDAIASRARIAALEAELKIFHDAANVSRKALTAQETQAKRCTCDNEDPFQCKCKESETAACLCVCHGI